MDKLHKLIAIMDEVNLGAAFISSRNIIKDITNCDYDEMYLMVTKFETFFLVKQSDFRNAKETCGDFHVIDMEEYKNGVSGIVRDVKRKYNIKRIGFEEKVVTVEFFDILKRKLNIKFAGVQLVKMSEAIEKYM